MSTRSWFCSAHPLTTSAASCFLPAISYAQALTVSVSSFGVGIASRNACSRDVPGRTVHVRRDQHPDLLVIGA